MTTEPPTGTELEWFEFKSAVEVWEALSEADRRMLLRLPIDKEEKERWSSSQVDGGRKFYGDKNAFKAWKDQYKITSYLHSCESGEFIDNPAMSGLIALGLAIDGMMRVDTECVREGQVRRELTYRYRYAPTTFGGLVARYGNAKQIVDRAKKIASA